jgi:hypothetical protein
MLYLYLDEGGDLNFERTRSIWVVQSFNLSVIIGLFRYEGGVKCPK